MSGNGADSLKIAERTSVVKNTPLGPAHQGWLCKCQGWKSWFWKTGEEKFDVAHSTTGWKCNLLFVNFFEIKSPISTVTEIPKLIPNLKQKHQGAGGLG
jgi:hypothetical protein